MRTTEPTKPVSHLAIRPDWLKQRTEDILEPELVIVDPHHHLWDQPNHRYFFFDFIEDVGIGRHNVRATVFIECKSMYRAHGDERLLSVGETEFANGAAAMGASGRYGNTYACAGIVGNVDLLGGDRCKGELEAHIGAAPDRFRGIRNIGAYHSVPEARGSTATPPEGLLGLRSFREGFSHLAPLGLSFDTLVYHTQLAEVADLAAAFPDATIVLNHAGGPIGIGPYAGQREQVFKSWKAGMLELAQHDNVFVKLGGFGMRLFGFGFENEVIPASSEDLAEAWAPYVETCVSAFGDDRCMFESNYPVDKGTCSYDILWNAYKRIAANWSPSEKANVFSDTAARVYRLADIQAKKSGVSRSASSVA